MKRIEAVSYIKNIIKEARTPLSDEYAAICVRFGESPSKNARQRSGLADYTASHLKLARLPIQEKGEILAKVYAFAALSGEGGARLLYSPEEQVIIEREAQQANRIAQNLTRAARRLRNS
jgi:hypothetical protein